MRQIDVWLFDASSAGNSAQIMALLDAGADVHARDKDLLTALQWSAACGHAECCVALIDRGSDVNAIDKNQRTPLHWAARNGFFDVCVALTNRGADVYALNKDQETSLHGAAINQRTEICLALIACGASPQGVESSDSDVQRILQLSTLQAAVELGDRSTLIKCLETDQNFETLPTRVKKSVALAKKQKCTEGPVIALSWLSARSAHEVLENIKRGTLPGLHASR